MIQNKKLRIAVLANANLPIPPYYGYGGTQRGIFDFVCEFNKKGHNVTLFAPLSSKVDHLRNVTLKGTLPIGLWEPGNRYHPEERYVLESQYNDYIINDISLNEYDIINIRNDDKVLINRLLMSGYSKKIVYSMHNVKSMTNLEPVLAKEITCVAHCQNHRLQYGDFDNIKVILYGINTSGFHFSADSLTRSEEMPTLPILKELKKSHKDYFIFISGIRSEKGQKTAIKMARRAGIPLIIAGTPERRNTDDFVNYFNNNVLSEVDNKEIFYFGNANEEHKKELLRFAKGFIFPSGYENLLWKEPFGRAPVEALASGTPVIAFKHGSMPEIIDHGFNGFMFQTIDEGIEQIKMIDSIDRRQVRDHAVAKFDCSRIADNYESLFFEMLEKEKPSYQVIGRNGNSWYRQAG